MEMEELFSFNEVLTICGTDEAGRGPLAGPVTAAAVVLPKDFPFEILADSKKLSHNKLIEAEKVIREKAVALSSLVTKILISCSKIENIEDRILFANAMNVDQLNQAITNYALYNNEEDLIEASNQVRELLILLYNE